tara:strand:- start:1251 stop:1892 length:642 start_codon:yes stop_codon:yes gene_type:complete
MSKIVVMGGSRGIGIETVKVLLERGHQVTAFSRSASDFGDGNPNFKHVCGDACNPADVCAVVESNEVVIQTLGVPLNLKLITGPIDLFSKSTRILIDAMEHAKVRRLISVTGFGAGSSFQSINCFQKIPFQICFGVAYRDKSIQETLIKNSSLDWTIVRPGVLTNQKLSKPYTIRLHPTEWRNGVISRSAVADFIASAVDDPKMFGAEPVLAN